MAKRELCPLQWRYFDRLQIRKNQVVTFKVTPNSFSVKK